MFLRFSPHLCWKKLKFQTHVPQISLSWNLQFAKPKRLEFQRWGPVWFQTERNAIDFCSVTFYWTSNHDSWIHAGSFLRSLWCRNFLPTSTSSMKKYGLRSIVSSTNRFAWGRKYKRTTIFSLETLTLPSSQQNSSHPSIPSNHHLPSAGLKLPLLFGEAPGLDSNSEPADVVRLACGVSPNVTLGISLGQPLPLARKLGQSHRVQPGRLT